MDSTDLIHLFNLGVPIRDSRIRTYDTLLPKQVLYQAELYPEIKYIFNPVITHVQ